MLRSDNSASFVENQSPTDYFQVIPPEISLMIFDGMDNQSLRALWATSRFNRKSVETYGQNAVYFAVGKPLSLTDYGSSNVLPSSYGQQYADPRVREGVSAGEVFDSLIHHSQHVLLFNQLAHAEKYRHFRSESIYDRRFDTYYTAEIAAIYVVSVQYRWKLKTGVVDVQAETLRSQPDLVQAATTPVKNVTQVHFAVFQSTSLHQFFVSRKRCNSEKDFSESIAACWDEGFSKHRGNLDEKLLKACECLFTSYGQSFLSSLFRHQHENVKNILNDLQQAKPDAAGLLKYVDTLLTLEESNPTVSKNGQYYVMLTFAKEKIESLMGVKNRLDVDRLLRLR